MRKGSSTFSVDKNKEAGKVYSVEYILKIREQCTVGDGKKTNRVKLPIADKSELSFPPLHSQSGY